VPLASKRLWRPPSNRRRLTEETNLGPGENGEQVRVVPGGGRLACQVPGSLPAVCACFLRLIIHPAIVPKLADEGPQSVPPRLEFDSGTTIPSQSLRVAF